MEQQQQHGQQHSSCKGSWYHCPALLVCGSSGTGTALAAIEHEPMYAEKYNTTLAKPPGAEF